MGDHLSPTDRRARPGTTVTAYRNGPYLIRGAFSLRDEQGNEIDSGRSIVALCRCGKSRQRPFCDGTHTLAGWPNECAGRPSDAPQDRSDGP
ncbi:MAG TPA: CDGSH iron-sulfur domain-containing protein [Solirubrobacteraceae bacterium]|jgi:CDGSH-type Zn-finger protein|nr:CDGSH iron-sulfur domain-containing protein [Solirubrobacteraceae bacterium]